MSVSAEDRRALGEARHPDPFAVLGPHRRADGNTALRVFMPGAAAIAVVSVLTVHASRRPGLHSQFCARL
jgi:1,4-alpha-glucan branching enzyme